MTGNIVQRPYLSGRIIDEFGLQMDVAAFSHQNDNVPDYHATAPWKAVGLGESGSCECDRGEYVVAVVVVAGGGGVGGGVGGVVFVVAVGIVAGYVCFLVLRGTEAAATL